MIKVKLPIYNTNATSIIDTKKVVVFEKRMISRRMFKLFIYKMMTGNNNKNQIMAHARTMAQTYLTSSNSRFAKYGMSIDIIMYTAYAAMMYYEDHSGKLEQITNLIVNNKDNGLLMNNIQELFGIF